jgi:aspartate 1-decarboxylase
MIRFFLRSRIEALTVTAVHAAGDGSILLDEHVMNAAELMRYERVSIYNKVTGEQLEAWVLPAEGGSGEVSVSSRTASRGDHIVIACYGALQAGQILDHKPKVVIVDEQNRVTTLTETITAPR